MKSTLTISFLALTVGTINAQPHKLENSNRHDDVFKYAQSIVESKTANKTSKTSAVQQRVIAESGFSIWGSFSTKLDTANFKYSGINGSKFDYNELFFNPYFFQGDHTESLFIYGEMKVKADSVMRWSDFPLSPNESIAGNFNAAGKANDYRYRNYWDNSSSERKVINYDVFGKPVEAWLFRWNLSTSRWDTSGKLSFAYNSSNQLAADTAYRYQSSSLYVRSTKEYSYDLGGYLLAEEIKTDFGTGLNNFLKYSFSYYPNHTVKAWTIDEGNGSGWAPSSRDSLGHGPNNLFVTHETRWLYDKVDMNWYPLYKTTRNVNAQGLPDTTIVSSYDASGQSWLIDYMAVTAYNAESNPEKIMYFYPGSAGLEYTYLYKFYYELYNNLSVNEQHPNTRSVVVFPNPAVDVVNIQLTEGSFDEASVQLTNSVGQAVRSAQIRKQSVKEQLSLFGLAPGLYYLNVFGNDGAIIHRQSLLKQ